MKKPDETKHDFTSGGMEIAPGRYYHSLFLMPFKEIPGSDFGGDVTGMLWRMDSEPTSWRIVFRIRRYAGKNNSPWDDQDKKTWASKKFEGTEAEALERVNGALAEIFVITLAAGGWPLAPNFFVIQGDSEKFFEMVDKTRQAGCTAGDTSTTKTGKSWALKPTSPTCRTNDFS